MLKSIIIHTCRFNKPAEHPKSLPPHNFEFLVYEAEEDEEEEIPDEISHLLEQEKKAIQPHGETLEIINLGTEEEKKEIRIGAWLDTIEKTKLVGLLREYVDVFAW